MNGNPGYQFIDTNILVYAHDISAGVKHQDAVSLIEGLWNSRQGCLSIQVLQEFCVNVTRKLKEPTSHEGIVESIAELANWRVHAPNAQDVLSAIAIHRRYNISFWDAMVIRSAQQLGCAIVWSEDLNAGQVYGDVLVRNPFTKGV
jgi:predicted nucleic acid-binding protein